MRGTKSILATILALAPLMSPVSTTRASLHADTPAIVPAKSSAVDVIPAACVSKTRIVPRTPGWVFVVNFDVFENGAPMGCLMLYRVVYAPTDFVPLPCKTEGVVNQVTYGGGKAVLNGGGFIRCSINIKQQLAALTPPAVVSDTAAYPYFTIVGVGSITITTGIPGDPYGNPIGYYRPDDGSAGLGLFAAILSNDQHMVSAFNGVTNTTTQTRILSGVTYSFTVLHDGGPDSFTTTHYLDSTVVGQYTPRAPVNFYTNGGAFWIGVAPPKLGITYRGTLDEVIFDPPDGGQPPSAQLNQQFLSFTPITLR